MDELGWGHFVMNSDEGIRGQVSRASNLRTLAFVSHFLVVAHARVRAEKLAGRLPLTLSN